MTGIMMIFTELRQIIEVCETPQNFILSTDSVFDRSKQVDCILLHIKSKAEKVMIYEDAIKNLLERRK